VMVGGAGPATASTGTNAAGSPYTQDSVTPAAGGRYTLLQNENPDGDVAFGMGALDVASSGNSWGTRAQIYQSNGTGAQQWDLVADGLGDGYFYVKPSYNAGLCLDEAGAVDQRGTPVDVYGCDPNYAHQPNQLWKPIANSNGGYQLQLKLDPTLVLTAITGPDNTSLSLTVKLPMVSTQDVQYDQLFSFYKPTDNVFRNWTVPALETEGEMEACPYPYFDQLSGPYDQSQPNWLVIVSNKNSNVNASGHTMGMYDHPEFQYAAEWSTKKDSPQTTTTEFGCVLNARTFFSGRKDHR
jgi:hypothetical protein